MTVTSYECFIEYMDAKKGFRTTRKNFLTYEEAKSWALENLERFNMDFIKYHF
jgi:hypothetical protein